MMATYNTAILLQAQYELDYIVTTEWLRAFDTRVITDWSPMGSAVIKRYEELRRELNDCPGFLDELLY